MIRIAYFSDIHTEFAFNQTRLVDNLLPFPLDLGPDVTSLVDNVDLVILAGDIGSGRPYYGASALDYARTLSQYLSVPVVFVPGNHEYYGHVFQDTRQELLSEEGNGVTVLDRRKAIYDIKGKSIRILGATLWTDYHIAGDQKTSMIVGERMLNDHRLIRKLPEGYWTAQDALNEHMKSRNWLIEELDADFDGHTVIATHHVPHQEGNNPKFPLDHMSASFASNCDYLIKKSIEVGVSGWVFGHNHYNGIFDVALVNLEGHLPLMTAQPGYPREKCGWTGPGIIEIPDGSKA